MYESTILYLLMIALFLYSGLLTYLYLRARSKSKEEDEYSTQVDVKIHEIGKRLDEIKEGSTKTKVGLEDEDW